MMHVSVPVGATLSVSSNHVVHERGTPAESSQMAGGLKRVGGGGWGECHFSRNRGEYTGAKPRPHLQRFRWILQILHIFN
jgi:hypothetical protein